MLTRAHLASLLPSGQYYNAAGKELQPYRSRCAGLLDRLNTTALEDHEGRAPLLEELLGGMGEQCWVMPRFLCEFGLNIALGDRALVNWDVTMLDSAPITFGDDVLIGPRCQFYSSDHPFDAGMRRAMWEIAQPITVGNSVWFGGGAIVLPGVTVGDGAIIGAGSVVTRDVPAGVLAVGNPARVLREVEEGDREVGGGRP
ncbi:sugar O-acetyltransferase [Streptomyces sp. NPDC059637]|uniref:sugar O-acetyltransferase n=1 Tax=Streptomyces TaxID=1883 RepID=UPI0036B7157F